MLGQDLTTPMFRASIYKAEMLCGVSDDYQPHN